VTFGAGLNSIYTTTAELSHNEYLRLLVETGVIGLTLTVIIYASLYKYTLQGYRDADTPYRRDLMLAFLMVLTARFVMAGADNLLAITVIEWYFWAFAGVIVVESGAYDRFAHIQDDKRALRQPAAETSAGTLPQSAGSSA
jgi:O-antigen ligase